MWELGVILFARLNFNGNVFVPQVTTANQAEPYNLPKHGKSLQFYYFIHQVFPYIGENCHIYLLLPFLDFCTISVIWRLAIHTRLVCAQFHIYCGSVFSVETRNWRNKAFSRSRVYVLWSTLNWGVTGHLAARHLFSLKWFSKLSFFWGFRGFLCHVWGFLGHLNLLLLRIQLKLNTALLSTVRPSVRPCVRHRRDISHFSHI